MLTVVSPYPIDSQTGNSISARRIVARLHGAGIAAAATHGDAAANSSGMIAINGWRLSGAIHRFRKRHPDAPLVVVLAGSDLYGTKSDSDSADTRRAMEEASALVVSQAAALEAVPDIYRSKCRVVPKSVDVSASGASKNDTDSFIVTVASNLRPEKAPLLPALATTTLPANSRIRVHHYGLELDPKLVEQAKELMNAPDSRYRWHGGISHDQVLKKIETANLFVNSSLFEGGANAVCEAIALGTPVLATRVPGNVGILDADYPGLFPMNDVDALTRILRECETSSTFLEALTERCLQLAPTFAPENESQLWVELFGELAANHCHANPT